MLMVIIEMFTWFPGSFPTAYLKTYWKGAWVLYKNDIVLFDVNPVCEINFEIIIKKKSVCCFNVSTREFECIYLLNVFICLSSGHLF